jgi:signal transduction histidine kinase
MGTLKNIFNSLWALIVSLFRKTDAYITDTADGRNAALKLYGQRLSSWLVAVTWKRLIVVLILLLIAGGMVSSCVEGLFSSERIETTTQTGKSDAADGDGSADKSSARTSGKVEVSSDGVIVTDPKTGERVIIDSKGIRPLKTPNVESVPTAPPAPPSPPQTSSEVARDLEQAKRDVAQAKRDVDQAKRDVAQAIRDIVPGAKGAASAAERLRITLGGKTFDVISQEDAEAIQEAIDNAEETARKSFADEVREEVVEGLRDEIRKELEAEFGKPRTTTKRTIVKGGEWLGSLIMAVIGLSVLGMVGAKVVFNTQAKAAAKVATAEEATERETLKRQLVEARLTTMQAQVEPHFLFNTLASVEHLIEVDPKRAALMQNNLIEYLRAAMPHMRDSTSTLGREQTLLTSFLAILQFRMEERLQFSVQIPSGLHTAEIPPMMLLSLVENSIKHGLEPKPEGGRIDVLAEIVDGGLRVSVRDTGLGFREGKVETSGTGIGLSNITERLHVLYGAAASFKIGPAPDGVGTLAVMDLPYKVKK